MPTPAPCGGRSTTCRPEEFSAMYDRLWARGQAALQPASLLHADQAQPEVRQCRAARRQARSAPICSAICGRRNGATSTTWWRPKGAGDIGYDVEDLLKAQGYDAGARW